MAEVKFERVRGTRDFLPDEMISRQEVQDKIRRVFERFGFLPWEGPSIEYSELLGAKWAGEEKLVYKFKDLGDREIVLKPESTPSLARIIASNPNLGKPLKLYTFSKVWRYDRPQKGRYREFYQCDFDIIGVNDMLADAEVIACADSVMKELGFKKYTIRLNSRKLMNQLMSDVGVSKDKFTEALRIIDKLDKESEANIESELGKIGLSEESIGELMDLMKTKGEFAKVKKTFTVDKEIVEEIETLLTYLKSYGVESIKFDLSLARGLEYYTGTIFEINAGDDIGSVGGGGRYDNLIGMYGSQNVPAVGFAFGFERVTELIKSQKLTNTQVYVIPIKENEQGIKTTQLFRAAGINADLDILQRGVGKNLDFANKQGIAYVCFIGSDEVKAKKVKLRDMKTGKEKLLTVAEVIKLLSG